MHTAREQVECAVPRPQLQICSQEALAKNLAGRTKTPLVAILVHGGPLDVSWLQDSPRIGAIMTAWYPGQVCVFAVSELHMLKS